MYLKLFVILFLILQCSPMKNADNSKNKIVSKVGESFTIELASNITTGFKWKLENSLDTNYLVFLQKEYKEPNKLEGETGVEIWQFKAIKQGITNLKFIYIRPWEKHIPKKTRRESYQIIIE